VLTDHTYAARAAELDAALSQAGMVSVA
jgi:hypothetical protein